jgi:hypothetical protein
MKEPRHDTSHTPVRDYDRDRYGYDHPASSPKRHGHSRFADRERDSWQGASPTYDPKRPDGRPSRTFYAVPTHDAYDGRDGWQRLHDQAQAVLDGGDHDTRVQGDAPTISVGSQYARAVKDDACADERLCNEICERLAHDDYDWAEIEVHVAACEATLTGTVPTREMKYEAERVAESVRGVREVVNQIRVRYEARG